MSSESELSSMSEVRKVLRANNPWIATEDIDGALEVTIESVMKHEDAQFQDGKRTVVAVHFTDHDKALVLNKTNADILVDLLTDDVTQWVGKKITLKAVRLAQSAFGKSHGVRVQG